MSVTTGIISGLREEVTAWKMRLNEECVLAFCMPLYVAVSSFCAYKQAVLLAQMRT